MNRLLCKGGVATKKSIPIILVIMLLLGGCSQSGSIVEYSPLTDVATQETITEMLILQGVTQRSIENFFSYVDEFNREPYTEYDFDGYATADICSLNYDRFAAGEDANHWARLGFSDGDEDINCRIAAFTLMQDAISCNQKDMQASEIIDAEIFSSHYLLDFSQEKLLMYNAIFSYVPVSDDIGGQEALAAILANWEEQGISFNESVPMQLICVYVQNPNSDYLQVAHAAVLLQKDENYMLLEKYNPKQPYLSSIFCDMESVILYLNHRLNQDKIDDLSNFLIMSNDICIFEN